MITVRVKRSFQKQSAYLTASTMSFTTGSGMCFPGIAAEPEIVYSDGAGTASGADTGTGTGTGTAQ